MDEISVEEVETLGDEFNITVSSEEMDWLIEYVNDAIQSIDDVDRLPVNEGGDLGERTWSEPDENPYNAINVECDVPPAENHSGLLDGMTVGVKDNIMVAGVPMTGSSKVMEGFVPSADSVHAERIREAGGQIVAKTNTVEFAAAPENLELTPTMLTLNPHNPDHWAGGSSGGSGAAVANGTVDVALGTDTGGSVRVPATYCGIVGLKPTYGLVPLHGVIENTYTQDHVGPMTNTVEETARLLEAVAGKTKRDPSSLRAAGLDEYRVGGYVEAVSDPVDLEELSVGILKEGLEGDEVTEPVREQTKTAIDRLSDEGVTTETVSIEHFEYEPSVKNAVSASELADHWQTGGAAYRRAPGKSVDEAYQSSFASRVESLNNVAGLGYKSRLMVGAKIISEENGRLYTRAQAARDLIRAEYEEALADVDVLLSPANPITAPPAEEGMAGFQDDDSFDLAYNTRGADVTRLPAITLPNGAHEGLPIGLQLIGPAFYEDTLLSAAESVSTVLD